VASLSGTSLLEAPTIFRVGASDGALTAGIVLGLFLSVAALAGLLPRACFALMTALYLGYAVIARTFLSFQWDNLLLECGLLATFLRVGSESGRPQAPPRWIRVLFVVLLWKLYAESGIAKWQSPLHDWQDGSAMASYYETAPLPTRLAWFAHAMPPWWHTAESWFTLAVELVVPFAAFGPRKARGFAFVVLTVFQLVNLATANYGFFVYLALALHVFLLDDRDIRRARVAVRQGWRRARRRVGLKRARSGARIFVLRLMRRLAKVRARLHGGVARAFDVATRRIPEAAHRPLSFAGAALVASMYIGVSTIEALAHFTDPSWWSALAPLRELYAPFRLVNTYHLFGAITRERIEPEVQIGDATSFTAHDLRHKPGDVARAPDFVAPHQPRVDFQLWFYGLGFRHGTPAYVQTLLERVCHDPGAVAPLFREPLPDSPARVRIAFWRYRFTNPEERRGTGAWWTRELASATRPLRCD
jgi:hypothetical protein